MSVRDIRALIASPAAVRQGITPHYAGRGMGATSPPREHVRAIPEAQLEDFLLNSRGPSLPSETTLPRLQPQHQRARLVQRASATIPAAGRVAAKRAQQRAPHAAAAVAAAAAAAAVAEEWGPQHTNLLAEAMRFAERGTAAGNADPSRAPTGRGGGAGGRRGGGAGRRRGGGAGRRRGGGGAGRRRSGGGAANASNAAARGAASAYGSGPARPARRRTGGRGGARRTRAPSAAAADGWDRDTVGSSSGGASAEALMRRLESGDEVARLRAELERSSASKRSSEEVLLQARSEFERYGEWV